MNKSNSLLTVCSITLLCLSCSAPVTNKPEINESETSQKDSHIFTQCKEPRPEICTREYNPVCATLNTGSEEKTYATGCTACADPGAIKYRQGPCEQ